MARLIQKSGYIKAGKAGGYMKYIATRERVERIEGSGPATEKQRQLIAELLRDYPDAKDSFEYEDFAAAPTVSNASSLITMALDTHASEVQQRDGYMKYIALRPRAERHGEHGLFGRSKTVSLDAALKELEAHGGNVWTIIYSLRREDAARLGYDHAEGWRELLRRRQTDFAAALKIQPDHLHWYAAFHDEGEHPHVHVMAWSDNPDEGYLSKDGLLNIQSKLTNDIFRGELQALYARKDVSYKEVTAAAREAMTRLARQLNQTVIDSPDIEQKLAALAWTLETVKGKKVYGYLKKPVKAQVDEIVDALAELPEVAACYETWNRLKDELDGYYRQQPREHRPLSQQAEFRAIKNMVIREAENLRLGVVTFEDEDAAEPDADGEPEIDSFDLIAREEALRQRAEADNDYSQYALAVLLQEQGRLREAAPWLERAAGNGNQFAQYRLAKLYLTGESVPRDTVRAAELLEASAMRGNQWAQYLLGKLLLQGKQMERDRDAAAEWLKRSAEQGNSYARFLLERMDGPAGPVASARGHAAPAPHGERLPHHAAANQSRGSARRLQAPPEDPAKAAGVGA